MDIEDIKMNPVECIEFRSSNTNNALLGHADFFVPKMGLEIHNCSVLRSSKTGHRFLNFPSRKLEEEWVPLIRFRNKQHDALFQKHALEAVDRWCEENQQEKEEEPGLPF